MTRPLAGTLLAVLVAAAAGLAALGCGDSPPPPPAGPLLVLDLKFEQPDGQRSIQKATLLFDGKPVASFQQPHPEIAVVFSKVIAGVAPGEHVVELRIDAQDPSPTAYGGGGFATYAMKSHPLPATGGVLATGQSLRWKLRL